MPDTVSDTSMSPLFQIRMLRIASVILCFLSIMQCFPRTNIWLENKQVTWEMRMSAVNAWIGGETVFLFETTGKCKH